MKSKDQHAWPDWKKRLHDIIFESDTFAGKLFDMALLSLILLSILVVVLDSIPDIPPQQREILRIAEWVFTCIFTAEYILRIISAKKPFRYVVSRYGIIDLIAILPSFISLLLAGTQYLLIIRALRLMRVFRILKMVGFLNEGDILMGALRESSRKIGVFITFIILLVIVLGSLMYVVEGGNDRTGFKSIPDSIYWAIVTLTTVGYGDITPETPLGKFLACIVMLSGFAIIAVPTGIMSAALLNQTRKKDVTSQTCPGCYLEGHDPDARFCKYCGHNL